MVTCDALIVGGGPAGSTCAWQLRRAGLDVMVVDAATFPRDKVCAGWITPQVVTALRFDTEAYAGRRTCQPITGFRVGLIGGRGETAVAYDRPISFGIRRCEFDHYLLQRADARLVLGAPIASIRRERGQWIVNDEIRAPMLIGAGGSGCPVARMLNGVTHARPLVVAREAESRIDAGRPRLARDRTRRAGAVLLPRSPGLRLVRAQLASSATINRDIPRVRAHSGSQLCRRPVPVPWQSPH